MAVIRFTRVVSLDFTTKEGEFDIKVEPVRHDRNSFLIQFSSHGQEVVRICVNKIDAIRIVRGFANKSLLIAKNEIDRLTGDNNPFLDEHDHS